MICGPEHVGRWLRDRLALTLRSGEWRVRFAPDYVTQVQRPHTELGPFPDLLSALLELIGEGREVEKNKQ